ncbi:hypothetical protein PV783_16460 [Chitinophaga sp. CC14]|uniref:hypothetical protein n=1 Tax=Chitinophaga sp. CC14 TaxID=3029199 RepID=UPI003B7EE4FF
MLTNLLFMKPRILLYAILLLCYHHSVFGQKAYNFGEGIIKIAHYFAMERNLLHPDTANNLFTNYTYYIKGSKVLRREGTSSSPTNSDKKITRQGDTVFKTTLTAKMVIPEYLLDFHQNKAYTFYTKKDQPMISVSPIRDLRYDLFFKASLSSSRNNNCILEAIPNQNGDTCAINYGYGIVGKDSVFFQFSTKQYPVESPLTYFFPAGTSPFITLLWAPTPGTGKDGKPFSGFSVLVVKDVIDVKLPDSLFTIPSNAILKENVSMMEMYDPNIP